jgi:hypothetical protein
MTNTRRSHYYSGKTIRNTLRLTFRVQGGKMRLLAREPLDMICPAPLSEVPEAGKHGGHWFELRDGQGNLLFHRTLHYPFGDSVEVFSPDGSIERVFGPGMDKQFDVLVPDDGAAAQIVLVGEPPDESQAAFAAGAQAPVSRELLRFDLAADIPEGGAAGAKP